MQRINRIIGPLMAAEDQRRREMQEQPRRETPPVLVVRITITVRVTVERDGPS